ncbi:SecY-interacting protein [Vibrio marisflavi]|uniref:Protein Syd n=1 Tax=Vibrio marisflavi CECT 7928 TaxID=634439 RepID=A0ABM9A2R3_9VIBR|nr:SecY-interacting protein [Vibrio marisflavi]CAH0538939.1 Protein Syd [Vibrio marisflavi CECT 7928]
MAQSATEALFDVTKRYVEKHKMIHDSLPASEDLADMQSECVQETADDQVLWSPVQRQRVASFDNVEKGIELEIHDDIKAFYGSQYSADIPVMWRGGSATLLQVWNDDDFVRLQENILGHLVTQRRLKLKPTVFIATTNKDMEVISICNLTGNVIWETLGSKERQVLAVDLVTFLEELEPEV